jgi:L-seryl-tRNA(Ser) seleniumtransferase
VNNNAAAVLLALNSLADRKEVIISRGQLVEIGGSFRIPEILKKAGSKLVEVGTTNRTHLKDYAEAITPRTRLLLWVHSSNYKMSGFTKEVPLKELVDLGREHGIPVMADLGSGALIDIGQFGLQREPLVSEVIAAGVDIATFSVDKLLAGPQGGIIAGKDAWLKKIEKNNLLRALRPDKTQILLTLNALQKFYSDSEPPEGVPVYGDFKKTQTQLKQRAEKIIDLVSNDHLTLSVIETQAQVGSGASPTETLPSAGILLTHSRLKPHKVASRLRTGTPAILGRVTDDSCIIDLKALREAEDQLVAEVLTQLC